MEHYYELEIITDYGLGHSSVVFLSWANEGSFISYSSL